MRNVPRGRPWAAALAVAALACVAHGEDWPQVGANPQHTSYTADSPAPPYHRVWAADFSPEMFYSAQPVVQGGRVFQTTLNGNLYALDLSTGQRLWHFRAGSVVWGSAACGTKETGGSTASGSPPSGEGLVFVAAWDGIVHALEAETGKPRWSFDTGEPISSSPCLADGMVYVGTRKGTLLALGVDGKPRWRRSLSWQLFNTVAWNAGKVYALTMDVRLHCLDGRTGEPLWDTDQLWGMVPREFYPVVHGGRVYLTLTPSSWRFEHSFGPYAWSADAMIAKYSKPLPGGKVEPNRTARMSALTDGKIPPELEEAQKRIIQFYTDQPQYQSFYVLDERTGKQAYPAVHLYECAGLQNTIAPPAVCADGRLVVNLMFGGARSALFDPIANRWTDYLFELWGANNDEWGGASVGGARMFSKNTFRNFMVDLTTRQTVDLGQGASGVKPVRVSVLPAPPPGAAQDFPFNAQRLGGFDWGVAGTYPPVIAGKTLLWAIHHPNILVAYEGSEP